MKDARPSEELPTVPPDHCNAFSRYAVLLCTCFVLYNIILSDNGLLLALMRGMRAPESEDIWIRTVKLPLLLYCMAGAVIFHFIRLILRKISRRDFILLFVCYFYAFYQLLTLNISHID